MKLVVITAVKAFEDQIKELLADQGVKAFSYNAVKGYRDMSDEHKSNWFASSMNQVDSLLFFAFVDSETSDQVFDAVEALNQTCDIRSKVHIGITGLDKFNSITKYY